MITALAIGVPVLALIALIALFAAHKIDAKPNWFDEEE